MVEGPELKNVPKLKKELRRLLIYSKLLTLATLNQYEKDGYPYRYLREELDMPEGALKSNINYLEKHAYIEKDKEVVDSRSDEVIYRISQKGITALVEIMNWTKDLQNFIGNKKEGA